MHTIKTVFAGSDTGTHLQTPLDKWNDTYQQQRFCQWRLSDQGQLLHQKDPDSCLWGAIPLQQTCCYITFSATIPTNQLFLRHLVIPLDLQHQWVGLPVIPPIEWQSPSPQTLYFTSFISNSKQHYSPGNAIFWAPMEIMTCWPNKAPMLYPATSVNCQQGLCTKVPSEWLCMHNCQQGHSTLAPELEHQDQPMICTQVEWRDLAC